MSSLKVHLSKLREERIAREKARLEKLREMNVKKYGKPEPAIKSLNPSTSKVDVRKSIAVKNDSHINNMSKRPITAPVLNNRKSIATVNSATNAHKMAIKSNEISNILPKKDNIKVENKTTQRNKIDITRNNMQSRIYKIEETSEPAKGTEINKDARHGFVLPKNVKKDFISSNKNIPKRNVSQTSIAKSSVSDSITIKNLSKPTGSRMSYQSIQTTQSATKVNPKRQSVFERLYQPKIRQRDNVTDSEKLQNDPKFLNKVISNTGLILGGGDLFNNKRRVSVRRSVSAVHFRRISKQEMTKCVHKWSSIGEKLDKVHLKDVDEDAAVKEDKIVSAVKSERKKVKFQTPISNFNTPKPEELQAKLQSWLQKRGKSFDSFQHLQCFGIHHLAKEIKPLNLHNDKLETLKPLNVEPEHFEDCLEDEDKENKPLESDSDDESYHEMMNSKTHDNEKELDSLKVDEATIWRRASCISDSVGDLNETQDTTLTASDSQLVDDLAMGAMNDLTQLLKEGYSWEQCARWLRAIRGRVPGAPNTAAYWECRAQLEARRGDLPASVHCWEQACAQGTEPSVVEANLDQLLDKFMQLKISPSSGQKKLPDPKLVDVKNVFKSTLIRFAVQQAKIRRSQELKLIVTPVRRSGRLSAAWSGRKAFRPPLVEFSSARKGQRTPLVECSTLREAEKLHPIFVPNETLSQTP